MAALLLHDIMNKKRLEKVVLSSGNKAGFYSLRFLFSTLFSMTFLLPLKNNCKNETKHAASS